MPSSIQLNGDGKIQLASATSISLGSGCCCKSGCCLPDCTCENITEQECSDRDGEWHGKLACAADPCTPCPPIDGFPTSWNATFTPSGSHDSLATVTMQLSGSATFSGTWQGSDYGLDIAAKCAVSKSNVLPTTNSVKLDCKCSSNYAAACNSSSCTTNTDCSGSFHCFGTQNKRCCDPHNSNNDPDCDNTFHRTTGPGVLNFSIALERQCGHWDIKVFVTMFGTGDGNGCHGVALGSPWSAFTIIENDRPLGDFSFDLDAGTLSGIDGHIELSLVDDNA
jgi:hypothetical protein